MKYYQYLFYKVYSFTKKLGNWEVAESAMYSLSVLESLSLIRIGYFFKLFPLTYYDSNSYYQTDAIIICLVLWGINYYCFLYKKKYKEIEKRFKKESKTSKVIGDIVVSLYAIGTVVSMLIW